MKNTEGQTRASENLNHGNSSPSRALKSRTESDLTYELKWAAWQWLYSVAECRAIAMEVRLEGPYGRIVDLVGVGKDNLVYIVEVKSSRADLQRDDKTDEDLKQALYQLATLQDAASLTAAVLDQTREHAVDATRDGSDWREDPAYKSAERENTEIAKRMAAKERILIRFSTKFHDPAFLACADFHYVMAPKGLITRAELPPYWGLLDEDSQTVVSAVQKQIQRNTTHVLRAVAKANTRDVMKACGVRIVKPPPRSAEGSQHAP